MRNSLKYLLMGGVVGSLWILATNFDALYSTYFSPSTPTHPKSVSHDTVPSRIIRDGGGSRINPVTQPHYIVERSEDFIRSLAIATPPEPSTPTTAKVTVHILISESGEVISVTGKHESSAQLKEASRLARQWKFRPYSIEGQPVRIESTLTLNFSHRF